MNSTTSIVAILLAGILTNNMVLSRFMGICPFLGVSKKVNTALSMSVAVTLVMVIATAVTHPIHTYLLTPYGLDYLQTVVFILVIAAIVQLIEVFLKKYIKPIYNALGIYLPLITTNCAVLGITTMLSLDLGSACFLGLNISKSYAKSSLKIAKSCNATWLMLPSISPTISHSVLYAFSSFASKNVR